MNRKATILLVDDIEENLVALEALLRREDAQIVTARSGTQALELILVQEFSLALIDVQMPEMDGFELAELMRGAERSRYIPIIFVTAGAGDAQRIFRGYETGAVDFLFKPIDSHTLRQKVDTFVRLDLQKKQIAEQYRRIQESEALLRGVMDATSALMHVKDRSGRYVTANRRYAEFFGVEPQGLTAKTDHELFPQEIAEALRRNDDLVIGRGVAMQVEERLDRADTARTYLSSKVPLSDSTGHIWGLCTVSTDISGIKRMEAELEQAIQAREDVLAVVSHDMRNFLQAIKSGSDMLSRREKSLSEDVKATIHARIRTTVDLMTRMITDLMDMVNIKAGRVSVAPQPEIINSIINEVVSVHEPIAQEKGIRLSALQPAGNIVVLCDRERILQVFANLLGNALKFCGLEAAVSIRTEIRAEQLFIEVKDSGPGIAADDLPHVFDPYWSAHENRHRGTGLGLYITKRIIEAHGTQIWIESAAGQGTTVHFSLPMSAVIG